MTVRNALVITEVANLWPAVEAEAPVDFCPGMPQDAPGLSGSHHGGQARHPQQLSHVGPASPTGSS